MGHWGIQPDQFWRMSMEEILTVWHARYPKDRDGLTDGDLNEMYSALHEVG